MQLPHEFRSSYEDFLSYPCNLVHKSTYASSLDAYKTRLDAAAPKLFTKDEAEVDVPFRDLETASGGGRSRNISMWSIADLRSVGKAQYSQRGKVEELAGR